MDLSGPEPDFATLARSMGCYSAGPIADPGAIRPAIEAAIREVKAGRPALVDVITRHR
jgi:acetolactate synthase-1/2/3 large subunit